VSHNEAPKTAGGMMVEEALDIVPKSSRELAGKHAGDALVNAAEAARDLTALVKGIASLPVGIGGFVARIVRRWRRLPSEKRRPLPVTMLLTAATGYADTKDADLRLAFENLLTSAIDVNRVHRVHPSFARMLVEMTGLEARMLRLMKSGGEFSSTELLSKAVGVGIDEHASAVAMTHLERLGLLKPEPNPGIMVPSGLTPPGTMTVGKSVWAPMTDNNQCVVIAVPFYGSYSLTPLGWDFIAVVDPDED
jgi:hypothetical protein